MNSLIKPSLSSKKSITLSKLRKRLMLNILGESRNLTRSALLLYNPKLLGVHLVVLETLNYNIIFKTTFLALRRSTQVVNLLRTLSLVIFIMYLSLQLDLLVNLACLSLKIIKIITSIALSYKLN
jgi:hypothetical protein